MLRAFMTTLGVGVMPSFLDAGTGGAEAPVSGTLQVPYPATVAAGNFLVLQVVAIDATSAGVSLPAGWTSITTVESSGDTTRYMLAAYKVAAGTETGNLDVTCTAGTRAVGRIYRFSSGRSVEAAGIGSTDASGTGMTAVNVTTLGSNRMLVQLLAATNVSTTIGDVTGESAGADYAEATAEYAPTGATLSCQTAAAPSAAANTGGSATLGSASTYRLRIGFAIVP